MSAARPTACVASAAPTAAPESPAPATKPAPAESVNEPVFDPIEPCRKDTPGHGEAVSRLEAFETLSDSLSATADPTPVNDALKTLLQHPCLKAANMDRRGELVADSGLAMKTWSDRGGSAWLSHYLGLWDTDKRRSWDVAVDMPTTLTLSHNPTSPLAPILCKHDDRACGRATSGWLLRAERHLELYAKGRHKRSGSGSCDETAKRYDDWVSCQHEDFVPRQSLPLGTFKVPRQGWLVVEGRRGHYNGCEEIRAYDLTTGSMFVGQRCGREAETQRLATLPLDALREAALMILLGDHVQEPGIWHGLGAFVPKGMKAIREPSLSGVGFGSSWSSAHTTLKWRWVRSGRAVVAGELRYPTNLNHAAKDHAIGLLRIAEAAGAPGCVRATLGKLPLGAMDPALVVQLQKAPKLCRSSAATRR